MNTLWSDNRLTLACKGGDTLVYDEFTRSRPEANNALLSVLEGKLLTLPRRRQQSAGYMDVHAEFRAIFTSNPEEYAGIHRTQDALMDRLITIKLDYMDRDTEIKVVSTKSGLPMDVSAIVVDIVRGARKLAMTKAGPSMRASIMIATVCAQENTGPHAADGLFREVCQDILGGAMATGACDGKPDPIGAIDELLVEQRAAQTPRVSLPRRSPAIVATPKPSITWPMPREPTSADGSAGTRMLRPHTNVHWLSSNKNLNDGF